MSYLFYDCSSLTKLPDISQWNFEKVININHFYAKCSSLLQTPDISKWNLKIKNIELIMKDYSSSLSSNNTKKSSLSGSSSNKGSVIYSEIDDIHKNEQNSENNEEVNEYYENFYQE